MPTEKLKAVLDTNVIVSAAIRSGGIPSSILAAGTAGAYVIHYSSEILSEYRDVLTRGKFALPALRVENLLSDIERSGKKTEPTVRLSISPDAGDNKFLECAEAADANYLVTGNTRHFPRRHRTTRVVTPRDFATVLISKGFL